MRCRPGIYLAESHRFRAGDDHGVAAAAHYGRAAELFSANGERWNLAWVRCDWAALSYERGQLAEALRLCGAAEDLARNLGAEQDEFLDHELLAKLSVIAAMSCLADGPAADQQAGWAYAAAALRHACAFQVRPGAHPDEYTQEFYFDIRAKVGRLIELAGPGGRRYGLQVVVDGWRGLWPEEPGQLDLTALAGRRRPGGPPRRPARAATADEEAAQGPAEGGLREPYRIADRLARRGRRPGHAGLAGRPGRRALAPQPAQAKPPACDLDHPDGAD